MKITRTKTKTTTTRTDKETSKIEQQIRHDSTLEVTHTSTTNKKMDINK